jgi:hypothetical protein
MCMTTVIIPDHHWQPLPLADTVKLFADASCTWCIGGGYAIELFFGAPIRDHGDTDVVVFRDQQLQAQRMLTGWQLFAADPPGTLRPWIDGEYLPFGIHDIWCHRAHVQAWELQIMLAEVDGDYWFMRRNPQIRGRRDNLVVVYGGVPCVRVEVQLLFKARSCRPKDVLDFNACLPRLPADARQWLRANLLLLNPAGHTWLKDLA